MLQIFTYLEVVLLIFSLLGGQIIGQGLIYPTMHFLFEIVQKPIANIDDGNTINLLEHSVAIIGAHEMIWKFVICKLYNAVTQSSVTETRFEQ